MRSAIRKQCSNSDKFTYTGLELSPLGLGIAPGGKLDTIYHLGRNGKMWMAVASHNGDMVWKPVPEDEELKPDIVPNDNNKNEEKVEESINNEQVKKSVKKVVKKPVKKEESDDEKEESDTEIVEEPVKKAVTKKPTKKATKKEENDEESKEPAPVKKKTTKKTGGEDEEKPKKGLTDYQKYMSWRMSQIITEEKEQNITRTQPERMRFIADEWKTIKQDEDKRKEVMEKVNASK